MTVRQPIVPHISRNPLALVIGLKVLEGSPNYEDQTDVSKHEESEEYDCGNLQPWMLAHNRVHFPPQSGMCIVNLQSELGNYEEPCDEGRLNQQQTHPQNESKGSASL
jgi:hypothetical protein